MLLIKLTPKRIVIYCLILAAVFAVIAAVSATTTFLATMTVLDAQWDNWHRAELGKAEVRRIQSTWIMYYNTCLFMTNGKKDTCLESARDGYIDGAHDMKPFPGFDWNYVQYGQYLDSG